MKHYRMISKYKGHHYFKLKEGSDLVTKVTVGTQPKKGRPYCVGITLITLSTFVSSYGWKLDDPEWNTDIKKISKKEYQEAFNIVLKKIS